MCLLLRPFACALVAVLSLISLAMAQKSTMQFPVSRDVGIDSWHNHGGYGGVYDKTLTTEEFTNFGGIAALVRGKKYTQHTILMDWDTEAINQWLARNTVPGDTLEWTFNVYPFEAPIDDVQIVTLESLNDWSEGDGPTNFENFNWTEDTGAATQNFAVTYWKYDDEGDKVLDEERSLPWIDDDTGTGGIDDNQYSVLQAANNFSPGNPIPNFVNSVDLSAFDLEDAALSGTFASVELDAELVNAILNDPNNRGIVFGPIDNPAVNAGTNWRIWTREGDPAGGLAVEFPGPVAPFLEVTYTRAQGQRGDFNRDGSIDAVDVNLLTAEVIARTNNPDFDVNEDQLVNDVDRTIWVREIKKTWFGDANLDGEFNSADFVSVFQAGEYEDARDDNSTWSTGDWSGDKEFDSADFVVAFQDGGFERGPRAASQAVPEPSTVLLGITGPVLVTFGRRRIRS